MTIDISAEPNVYTFIILTKQKNNHYYIKYKKSYKNRHMMIKKSIFYQKHKKGLWGIIYCIYKYTINL
ncbi:MAG: hypothetical protein ABS24_00150 [SAR92 bacterium BACL26 MAG-121220-bin70]|uniref:Uncharacterized protein n=1 Tax=SAR92 bacterium BACL26 MAG-121220-bin70 TaxID=1655626 RepID=A0A0R2U745_9GAMM|nr:MAG: hypothetical protein ABS24_00150 [SAR92 bacterium BACL26 MAG-121220-bin70]